MLLCSVEVDFNNGDLFLITVQNDFAEERYESLYNACYLGNCKTQFIGRATAVPNQIQSIIFRRKTIECVWFSTTVARQQHDVQIEPNAIAELCNSSGY